jgi:hypothetical protein
MAVWHILWPFGNILLIWYIIPHLVYFIKKNLATLALLIKLWEMMIAMLWRTLCHMSVG